MQTASRVLRGAVRASGSWAWVLGFTAVVGGVLQLMFPAAVGLVVDAALTAGRGVSALTWIVTLVALMVIVEAVRAVSEPRVRVRGTTRLRLAVIERVFTLGLAGRDRFGAGDLTSRTLESAAEAANGSSAAVTLMTSTLTSIGGLVALFLIHPGLGLVFLVAAPVAWWSTHWLIRRMTETTELYQQTHATLAGRFLDAMGGITTIRASGAVEREIDRVLEPLAGLRAAGERLWAVQAKAGWRLGLIQPITQVAVLAVAGIGVVHGRISPGELFAATGYVGYAMGLLRQVTLFGRLARAMGSARRVAEVLGIPVPPAGTRPLPVGGGTLCLHGVCAERDGKPVLRDVDLVIPAGASVAVVGASGAGKTTLAEIAGGLRVPSSGRVLLDGVPVDEIRPAALRSAVAYAFQRPVLLGDTVADAINYSDHQFAQHRIRTALVASAAAAFVDSLPGGVLHPVATLCGSGGEVQRLGLARALCRDAQLLVLDDALSSVDNVTEAEITAVLSKTRRNRTTLVVAYRPSTLAWTDLVAWLDNGRIRALAPHRELLANTDYMALFSTADPASAPTRGAVGLADR